MFYETTFHLDGRDMDWKGNCKISALLGHLQRAAMMAAHEGGFGHDLLLERYGAIWMLARTQLTLNRPIRWNDILTIRTWHRGGSGAMMYRDYDLYVGEEPVGTCIAGWVLASHTNHSILRLSHIDELQNTSGGDLCKTQTLANFRVPTDMPLIEERQMRYSDSDLNGHINNTRYADFVQDALHQESREHTFLSELELNYTKECRVGETLYLHGEQQNDSVCMLGMDKDGKTRFKARVIFSEDIH